MVLGVGIDIIEVERIQGSYERFGERFLQRVLCPEEVTYCLSHARPAPHLAARFAAKEAISKAFGTGLGVRLGWQDIEVARRESGQPYVIWHGGGRRVFEEAGATHLHLGLSHTRGYAAAVAVLEKA
jgi:holo-[acyl-carrier protein] synthase